MMDKGFHITEETGQDSFPFTIQCVHWHEQRDPNGMIAVDAHEVWRVIDTETRQIVSDNHLTPDEAAEAVAPKIPTIQEDFPDGESYDTEADWIDELRHLPR